MRIDLTGKIALVTGASRGIGRAIAEGLGSAGARVAVHYRRAEDAAREIVSELPGAVLFQADLTEEESCISLIDAVHERMGAIDVLVNNAGVAIAVERDALWDDWRDAWEKTLALNLRAPEILMRCAINRHLEAGTDGHRLRIINIASRAAFRGDTPEYTAYAASKGGLVALTRTIARGYGKADVVAFTVAPGFTDTDMAGDFVGRYGEQVIGDLALDRLTRPSDVAPIVVFLASGLADHATGSTIDINAGSYVH